LDIWRTKDISSKDLAKVKSWLFTTLHREFLQMSRLLSHCCDPSAKASKSRSTVSGAYFVGLPPLLLVILTAERGQTLCPPHLC
jgi:hypothetical protein